MNAVCSKCGKRHGPLAACYSAVADAEHRMADPGYGVPTGVVPRVRHSIPPATGYATAPHVPGEPVVGAQFVAALPEGFDERTRLAALRGGEVVVVHPDHAPRFIRAVHRPDYGVPTGAVPRIETVLGEEPPGKITLRTGARPKTPCVDRLQKAVDDYILMERKAKAWDELVALYARHDTKLIHLDVVKGLLSEQRP
jgi:hypothetical protein